MKIRFRQTIILIAILLCCLTLGAYSLADAGNFSGGSDWGGGGSSWSGGSSWDSGSSWSSGSTYDSSSYDSDGSISSVGCLGGNLFTLIIIVIVVITVLRYMRSGQQSGGTNVYQAAQEEPGLPLDTLKQKDPNFNEQALLEKVGNQYIQMQNAWQNKDWEPMRAIMTDALYNQMARQLQTLVDAKQTNYVERIAVLETRISRYAVEADNDVLVVRLSTRITDYTKDDRTDAIISGSTTRELFMVYDWKLIRQKDQKTLNQPSVTQISCPNCGAPLDINHSGKCPYCSTIVTLKDHDWALSVIKGISQRTV
ncbi:MAG TPA: Tim44-like domain-containing protein [Candidatus Cryosericum sp.]|nr:Tim44-like domain-containing protein [Candidatus Cryosericum sp.]